MLPKRETSMKSGGSRVVIILGMHRSGTSSLAGILEGAGLTLGKVSRQNLFNPKGNLESKKIIDLNDALLRHNGGAWDNPPARIDWPEALKQERDLIIRGYRDSLLWGFKDPRLLLTLDGWLEGLSGHGVSFAATFRRPGSVAQSLYKRNQFSLEKSLFLWKTYNEKLLAYHEAFHFPVVSFDLPETDYRDAVERLLQRLALTPDRRPGDFFENELRYEAQAPEADFPPEIESLYKELERIAL